MTCTIYHKYVYDMVCSQIKSYDMENKNVNITIIVLLHGHCIENKHYT